jgi:hypothetical protein
MTSRKKTIQWTGSLRRENRTADHPALEFSLAVLFFLMLILTAAAFLLLSPPTAVSNLWR